MYCQEEITLDQVNNSECRIAEDGNLAHKTCIEHEQEENAGEKD